MVIVSLVQRETRLIQVLKPHSKAITILSINPRESILVSGSDDSTIFICQLSLEEPFIVLRPIGYIEMPSAVSIINWKPQMVGIYELYTT